VAWLLVARPVAGYEILRDAAPLSALRLVDGAPGFGGRGYLLSAPSALSTLSIPSPFPPFLHQPLFGNLPAAGSSRRKSSMKRIALIFLTLISATSLFAQNADPSPADQGKPGTPPIRRLGRNWIWNRLNLAEDQKEKLKQIREADRESLSAARAQVAIARESLKAALLANPDNVPDIQAKASDLGNALSTSSVQTALHLAKINQVLTPAQRVALEEANARRIRNWRQHRRDRMEGRAEGKDQQPRQTPAEPKDD
jgi:Spy/CpxP family protein refolding chaperone